MNYKYRENMIVVNPDLIGINDIIYCMSGHSKWSTIKRKKGIADQKRGQIFSKMSRLITLAVIEGGGIGDPEKNVKLRLAIERARAENMPKENISRAIEKAIGGAGDNVKEVVYEAFGPGGVSLIIAAATDNPNRTHSEIKKVLEKMGGKMGTPNAVAHLFDKCGVVVFEKRLSDESAVFEFADSCGAYDIEENETSYVVYIPFEKLGLVSRQLQGLKPSTIDVFYRSKAVLSTSPKDNIKVSELIEALQDLDDVDKVYSNRGV